MPGSSSRGIFLSYRREDAAPYARLVQRELSERIPDARVFFDIDSVEAGMDFSEAIREALVSCAVFVTLIGRQWATLADEEGNRRLDDPGDYVRLEVETALERGIRVIPVLVDRASPLKAKQLPSNLRKLARLHAVELSHDRYEFDVSRLLDLIQRALGASAGPVGQSPHAMNDKAVAGPRDVRPNGNALSKSAKHPEPIRTDRARAIRVLAAAERIASSIPSESTRASALVKIARAVAVTNPDRAALLIADAERFAESSSDQSSFGESGKIGALVDVATALGLTDPDRAARLIDDAERIAQSLTYKDRMNAVQKVFSLIAITRALTVTDPGRAERLAQTVPGEMRVSALVSVAKAVAVTDSGHAARLIDDAERVAQSISGDLKAGALAEIAKALAATDPGRAERIAQSISGDLKAGALAEIAKALAATDPGRAERIAQSISGDLKAGALAEIAKAVAVTDPGRAARLIDDAERIVQSLTEVSKARALADIAAAVAVTDPGRAARLIDDAERVAQSITGSSVLPGLVDLMEALWPADVGDASRPAADADHAAELSADPEGAARLKLLRRGSYGRLPEACGRPRSATSRIR